MFYFSKLNGSYKTYLEINPVPEQDNNCSRNTFSKRTIPKYYSGQVYPGTNYVVDYKWDTVSDFFANISILYLTEAQLDNLKIIFKESSFHYGLEGYYEITVCLNNNSFTYNIIQGTDLYEAKVNLRKVV